MTATITKTAEAQPMGEYVPTSVDVARDAAVIVVTGYVRNRTEIVTRRALSGPGVKFVKLLSDGTAGIYLVNDEAMTELRRRYTVATGF